MKTIIDIKNIHSQQNRLARYFGKKYGEFLYSGSLALEVALKCANVKKGDYILIPNNVCYRVLWSVIRSGARPIIVTPRNGYTLEKIDIEKVLKDYPVKIIILVHNMGLPIDVESIRNVCSKNVTIIEDVAQVWQEKNSNKEYEKYSDYVVTSFGATKPLSFGIGGAIFSNTEYFRTFIDDYSRKSRENTQVLMPYLLPDSLKIDLNKLIKVANKNVTKQKLIANQLIKGLKNSEFKYWEFQSENKASWHRFPIWTDDEKLFKKAIEMARCCQIEYELPHKMALNNLPLAINNSSIYIDNTVKKYYHINIKTRQNLLKNIKKWIKLIK